MAGLSVSGLSSSGIDVTALVGQLMQVEKMPQDALNTKKTAVLAQGTAWASINTQLTAVSGAIAAMNTPSSLNASTVTSSDATVLSATATGSAPAASISVQVTSLAAAQQRASAGYASTSSIVGAGTFLVAGGAESAGFSSITSAGITDGRHSLTVKTGADVGGTATLTLDGTDYDVTVGSGPATIGGLTLDSSGALKTGAVVDLTTATTDATTSLSGLASALASYGGPAAAAAIDLGSGTSPAKLVLSAAKSGTANAVMVSGSGDLTALAAGMSITRAASDAVVSMGSLTVTRSSNTISDMLPGVTLNLAKAAPGQEVTLTVGRDPAATGAKVQTLVDSLNKTLDLLASTSSYDLTAHVGQPLSGDSRVRSLSQGLSGLGSTYGSSGSTVAMSQLGVGISKDGRYTFDAAAFSARLTADPDGTAALMSKAANSISSTVTAAIGSLGVPGWIKTAQDGVTATGQTLQSGIDAWDTRLASMQTQYMRQYSALDVAINSLNSQKSWLASTMAGLTTNYGA